jgi:LacI family transcriptional regulator
MEKTHRLTSRDIARLAGVSQTTVSRVFAGDPNVSPEKREIVFKVANEVGYVMNPHARAMRSGRSNTIGVVVTRITNPLHAQLMDALGRELVAANLEVVLWSTELGSSDMLLGAIQQRKVDGILVTSATIEGELERQAVALGIPTVLVHRGVKDLPCDQVLGDNFEGARATAAYSARGGRTRVAVIAARRTGSASTDRVEGFLAGATAEQLDVQVIHRGSTHNDAAAAAQELLRSANPVEAIFGASDMLALGAIDGARALGMRVPEDLWVAGFDNIEMSSWHSYSLTTVAEPVREMAQVGVEMLRKRIAGSDDPPIVRHLPSSLIVRDSTANFGVQGGSG